MTFDARNGDLPPGAARVLLMVKDARVLPPGPISSAPQLTQPRILLPTGSEGGKLGPL